MNNNNDFLRQFFKEQNIFQHDDTLPEPQEENTKNHEEEIFTTPEKKEFCSHKEINLKTLFQQIEQKKITLQKIAQTQTAEHKTEKTEKTKQKEKIKPEITTKDTEELARAEEKTKEKVKEKIKEKEKKRESHTLIQKPTPFQTQWNPTHTTPHHKKNKKSIKNTTSFSTNFKKFKKFKEQTEVKKEVKRETIDENISFTEIIQEKNRVKLENILGSQHRGHGKNRLSRITFNNGKQKEYILDLWETHPNRYSNHDQKPQTKQTQPLEKQRKKQEFLKKTIQYFSSVSSFFSQKSKNTHDFLQKSFKNTTQNILFFSFVLLCIENKNRECFE